MIYTSEKLGLGCGSMINPINKEENIKTIHAALDAGINHLNTADFYGVGQSEIVIGEVLKGRRRDDAFVSVKFGALMSPDKKMYGLDVRPLTIKNYLTHTLKRLNLEYIDLYQPARIDLGIPVEETIGAISELVEAGYVRNIGVTQIDAKTLRKANNVHKIKFVEAEYSLFNREIEEDIIPTARELGIDIVGFGSLAHGLLSGTWTKDKEHIYNSMIPLFFKENINKNLEIVKALGELANEKNITIPQLSIAWLMSKGDDIVTLIGASRRESLLNSIKAKDVILTNNDIIRIENIADKNKIAGASFPKMNFRNGRIDSILK
ncbi:MAG: aldo/keto reductase [Sarcina sp.]